MRLLLIASLAVNLALIGVWGGAVLGHSTEDAEPAERRLPFLMRVLPESHHDRARAFLTQPDQDASADREAMRTETLAAIRAEPFEPERLKAAFDDWNEATVRRRSRTQAQIVEIANDMSPDERVQMAERFEAMIERWRERRAAREAAARAE